MLEADLLLDKRRRSRSIEWSTKSKAELTIKRARRVKLHGPESLFIALGIQKSDSEEYRVLIY